ncbi:MULTISPECIES: nitronate monooxygenase family protein [unclassified Crossiella]|uniref:NAD(P)H-dependent flavin oxidoreductase n=1 Tax=unclassified Crossiella TaxID=2620835 RepID=UPI001FFF0FC8|nr:MULTISPECIES: nitronate monooxygenase [unclassified Crossiella]MCK2241954.1 nitronate monooxygenase [Crossiella sp. S99.2]MCK2255857.1 nitronate monooxygenase [Crossiella sp. S99.1]
MDTALTRLVGVRHPVVQTGMGWVAGPRLVSATANAGGLGILASATMTFAELEHAIRETRSRTRNPFGVNLRADAQDAAARVDLLIREQVRVVSFALAPKPELITKLKAAGIVVIPSVGAARHARKVADWGADAVLVQGNEGGGHTGGIATTLLLPAVVDAVDLPVIAAGGFFDGRGLAAALCYGAAGIAMGTRFLLTQESPVPDAVKQRYLAHDLNGTVVTHKVDGLPHRVLRTELVDRLEHNGNLRGLLRALANARRFRRLTGQPWPTLIREGITLRRNKKLSWAQTIMAANTPMLLRAGLVQGDPAAGVLASGQVVGLLEDLPTCAELIEHLVTEAEEVLRRNNPA